MLSVVILDYFHWKKEDFVVTW